MQEQIEDIERNGIHADRAGPSGGIDIREAAAYADTTRMR